MAERKGQDFVWVRPAEGFGQVTITSGRLTVRASRAEPCRVTRGEWEVILKRRGVLETCEGSAAATSSTGSTSRRKWKGEK